MKTFKRCLTLITFCSGLIVQCFAQGEVDNLLRESASDGRKLIDAYISPFMKSLALGMNQGWYNTAKPHKIAGFDLTLTVSALSIPDNETFFEPGKLGLQRVTLDASSPGYPMAPTVFGKDDSPAFRQLADSTVFPGPPGLGLKENIGVNFMPVPMVHLGFGLPKNTDIKLRFSPSINIGGNGEFKLFGVGIMHDVKQWIPGIKLLPFDLSAFAGFTRLTLLYHYTDGDVKGENQRGEFGINATSIQAIISKKFSALTLYGGIGYNIANSNLGIKGTFDINDDGTISAEERDPLDLKYESSGARLTAGFRLKLAVLTIHADYTLQRYNSLTIGLGASVR